MESRLAEPLVALSGVGDYSRGPRTGAAARTCFIACRLARAMGVPDAVVRDVFYAALLQHVGCVGYAPEAAAVFAGRDVQMNLAGSRTDFATPADIFRTFIPELASGVDVLTRMRIVTAALVKAPRLGPVIHRASCEVGASTARRIGLGEDVARALLHIQEWYDGRGGYLGVAGEAISVAARVVVAAFTATVFHELGDAEAALMVVSKRAGRQLDPDAAAAFSRVGRDILSELESLAVDEVVADEEPTPHLSIDPGGLDEVVRAFGEIVDLKTLTSLGSARRGYELADSAAAALRIDAVTVGEIRRAAALRDIGKAAIPNTIVEKRGPLTAAESDAWRLHAYFTERTLARARALAGEAALAGMHHEHEDGSGYHRGIRDADIPMGAKILAAVDAFVAATQPGDEGNPISVERACAEVDELGRSGTLNRDATRAVIAAATDTRTRLARTLPAGLSERQVEVLCLVARGLSNKQIAEQLVVSPRTAEHHVQDIYAKLGASSRAAAALFAMQHRLL